MRMVVLLLLVTIPASQVSAGVTAKVYLADELTPLALNDPNDPNAMDDYRRIMVGTHLTIFIESDSIDLTSGSLLIDSPASSPGLLEARDLYGQHYLGSTLDAVGFPAFVANGFFEGKVGFDFYAVLPEESGRWFVFDYYAVGIGDCNVYRYDCPNCIVIGPEGVPPEDPPVLMQVLSLHHDVSRDFDGDAIVDFTDFASLAAQWKLEAAVDANEGDLVDPNTIAPLDLHPDGHIDVFDMLYFVDYWLEKTDFIEPNEPNEPASTDPNLLLLPKL